MDLCRLWFGAFLGACCLFWGGFWFVGVRFCGVEGGGSVDRPVVRSVVGLLADGGEKFSVCDGGSSIVVLVCGGSKNWVVELSSSYGRWESETSCRIEGDRPVLVRGLPLSVWDFVLGLLVLMGDRFKGELGRGGSSCVVSVMSRGE